MPPSRHTVWLILPSDSACWFPLSCYCNPVHPYESNCYTAPHCEAILTVVFRAVYSLMKSGVVRCYLIFQFLPHTTSISSGFTLFGVAIAEGMCQSMHSSLCRHSLSRNPRRAYHCTVGVQQKNRVEFMGATFSTNTPRHPTLSLL